LDYYQSQSPNEPLAIGGFLPLEKVYSYDPIPSELNTEQSKHVLGVQANLWTEYISTTEQAEYMLFPRAIAIAETGWSTKESKNYDQFATRLSSHLERLQNNGVNVAKHVFDVQIKMTKDPTGTKVSLATKDAAADIFYTTDGTEPNAQSQKYAAPFITNESINVKAAAFRAGQIVSNVTQEAFTKHKAIDQAIALSTPPNKHYNNGGSATLVNGKKASDRMFNDGEWIAWNGENFAALIDLGSSQTISHIETRFFNDNGPWIYLPKNVDFSISENGVDYQSVFQKNIPAENENRVVPVSVDLTNAKARYVKVSAERFGIIPEGRSGAGNEAWLFVDEVIVK